MNLGKSILLSIILLCYGANGYAAMPISTITSIADGLSQYEAVIKKISFSYWYVLSAKERYVDPWAPWAEARQRQKNAQEEQQQSKANTSTNIEPLTSSPAHVDMRVLGLILLIVVSLALYAIKEPSRASSKSNEPLKGKEVDVGYEGIQQAQVEAEQGNVAAQIVLGQMYYDGQGTPQDFKQAYIWFSVATAMGSLSAKKLRDQAIEKLTPEGIEAAQAHAARFFESLTSKKTQEEPTTDLEKITITEKELNAVPLGATRSNEVDTSSLELTNTTEQKIFYKSLLNGDYSLARTFWIYFTLFNVCFGLLIPILFEAVTTSLPIFVITFCIVAWWQISTTIGTIRSAFKYKGPKVWSVMAITITAVNSLFVCVWALVFAYAIF